MAAWISTLLLAVGLLAAPSVAGAQQPPTRQLVEDFRIGGAENQLSTISGIHPMPNGNIVVIASGDYWAMLFGPTGTLIKRFIRKGAGPGEARDVGASGILGDSLWISDRGLRRVTFFSAGGEAGRQIAQVDNGTWKIGRPDAGGLVALYPRHMLPHDTAIAFGAAIAAATALGQVTTVPLYRTTWGGTVTGHIVEVPRAHYAFFAATLTLVQPFVISGIYAISPDGKRIGIVTTVDGRSPTISLVHVSPRADTLTRSTIPFVPEPIGPRAVDSAIATIVENSKLQGRESEIRAGLYLPAFLPPVRRIVLANDGSTWLRLRDSASVGRWLIISAQGKSIGRVALPASVSIELIDHGIWAIEKDRDDVPSIVRFRMK